MLTALNMAGIKVGVSCYRLCVFRDDRKGSYRPNETQSHFSKLPVDIYRRLFPRDSYKKRKLTRLRSKTL